MDGWIFLIFMRRDSGSIFYDSHWSPSSVNLSVPPEATDLLRGSNEIIMDLLVFFSESLNGTPGRPTVRWVRATYFARRWAGSRTRAR